MGYPRAEAHLNLVNNKACFRNIMSDIYQVSTLLSMTQGCLSWTCISIVLSVTLSSVLLSLLCYRMPHFYRYRVEENYSPLLKRTPAATPVPSRRNERTEQVTARLSLLGCQADISVPSDSDKVNLSLMFSQLDSTVRELREENKELR